MAKAKTYAVGTAEGVEFAQKHGELAVAPKIGDTVSLLLSDEVELAVLCAGWLNDPTKKPDSSGATT